MLGMLYVMKREIERERCVNCGCAGKKVFVHGHTQCPNCRTITDGDCCQGSQLNVGGSDENEKYYIAQADSAKAVGPGE